MQRSHDIEVVLNPIGLTEAKGEALFVGVFKGPEGGEVDPAILRFIDGFSDVKLADILKSGEIQGDFKEFTILHTGAGKPFARIMLIGLGKRDEFDNDRLRSGAAKAARTLRKIRVRSMHVDATTLPGLDVRQVAQALTEGVVMGCFRPARYTESNRDRGIFEKVEVVVGEQAVKASVEDGVRWGKALGIATNKARDLANAPGNEMTPTRIIEEARKVSQTYGMEFTAWGNAELEERGFGGILAVGKGSIEPCYLGVMRYNGGGKDAPLIALVGKGVSFDTGGISIKPAASMHHMKYDMHGAASVIGALQAIAELKLPINVIGVIPTAENMPDAKAYKPGDVVKMYGPKYVEIINTDAEGRMLLADALYYACQQDPDLVIDLATLTGAIVIALGTMVSGLFTNNEWLSDAIRKAGAEHAELYWPLPTWDHYDFQLRSSVADLTNTGGRAAGSCTAARFLAAFVDRPWAHLDIAGTGWIEEDSLQYVHKSYNAKKGATGVGVRTLAELARQIIDVSGGDRAKFKELLGR